MNEIFTAALKPFAPPPALDRNAVIEDCATKLQVLGDAAYGKGYELSKRDLCLGEEHKIKTGTFTVENLKALEEVRTQFGMHNGFYEAARAIRALKS